jgi:hypothetical protein
MFDTSFMAFILSAWVFVLAASRFSLSNPNLTSHLSNMALHMAVPLSSLSLLSGDNDSTIF